MSAACRSCGAAIAWAVTEASGALIPLNADPDPAGNLAVRRDDRGELIVRVLAGGEEPRANEVRGTSHFVTCPSADAHRRRRTPVPADGDAQPDLFGGSDPP